MPEGEHYLQYAAILIASVYYSHLSWLGGTVAISDTYFLPHIFSHELMESCLGWMVQFLMVSQQNKLLQDNPSLESSFDTRRKYLDPLNHLQVFHLLEGFVMQLFFNHLLY